MKKDKSIQKIMQKPEADTLPYSFETRVMNKIFIETAKNKKRTEKWGFVLVSAVSVFMIAGVYLVLKNYLPVRFDIESFITPFTSETYSISYFFIYIAGLVLLLLVGDTCFRRLKQKLNSK